MAPRFVRWSHTPRVRVDTLVDRWVLRQPTPTGPLSLHQQLVRDAVHFNVSLANELICVAASAPAFLGELLRDGLYARRMRFRKLPSDPRRAEMGMLKRCNPSWEFRQDFDPAKWVFVFLHGYVDNTGADRVAFKLAELGYQVYLVRYPFLRDIREVASALVSTLDAINEREPDCRLVPIGHSLGGCIWDELLLRDASVVTRYRMPLYISLGSPHFGTLAAHLGVGKSAAQMRPQSDLVRAHLAASFPSELEIYPFVSRFDLLVLPIETALLQHGINYVLSETGHLAQVVRDEVVMAIEEIVATPRATLEARAIERAFYPSTLASLLGRLPRRVQRRLGIEDVLRSIAGDDKAPPTFKLRIVHHEIGLGMLAPLRREP